jgi:hypothetical protein
VTGAAVKACRNCGVIKPIDQFTRDAHYKSGISNRCRVCDKVRSAETYRRRADQLDAGPAGRATARAAAVEIYGGRCAWCGLEGVNLQFDHMDADGAAHRARESHQRMFQRIAATGAPLADVRLQLLCEQCHRNKTSLDATYLSMRRRGIMVSRPERPASVGLIAADAQAWLERVLS